MELIPIILGMLLIVAALGMFAWFTYLIAGDIILQHLKIMKHGRK
jgi:hypothetical protein